MHSSSSVAASPLHDSGEKQELNMKVFCRVRPAHRGELISSGAHNAVSVDRSSGAVRVASKQYSFDAVYDSFSGNEAIYTGTCKEHINHAFAGYCGTLMCYGQTGSGKTWTMSNHGGADEGILFRAVRDVFSRLGNEAVRVGCRPPIVRFNYLQLYRDNLQDLLNPDTPFLKFRRDDEDSADSPVKDVTWTPPLQRFEDFMQHYLSGDRHRVVAETKMNKQSSRGHSVLTLSVTQPAAPGVPGARDINGQLVFVDLAGYERMNKTMVEGVQKDEARHINLSLSALSSVIHALTMRSPHVPWRNSKLTRLLKRSVSGNSITSVILNIGPSSAHVAETINTLYFGHNALQCKTTVHVNLGELDYKKEYASLSALVRELKLELSQKPVSVGDPAAVVGSQDDQVKRLECKVADLESTCEELQGRCEQQERQIEDADIIITEMEAELEDWKERFMQLKEKEERREVASAASGDTQSPLLRNPTMPNKIDLQHEHFKATPPPPPPAPPPQHSRVVATAPSTPAADTSGGTTQTTSAPSSSRSSTPSSSSSRSTTSDGVSTVSLISDVSFQSTSDDAQSQSPPPSPPRRQSHGAHSSPMKVLKLQVEPAGGLSASAIWLLHSLLHDSPIQHQRRDSQQEGEGEDDEEVVISLADLRQVVHHCELHTAAMIKMVRASALVSVWAMEDATYLKASSALDPAAPRVTAINVTGDCVEGTLLKGTFACEFMDRKVAHGAQKAETRWLRFRLRTDGMYEDVEVVGIGSSYQLATADIGAIIAFEVIPLRLDGAHGMPVSFRVRSVVRPCEPCAANLRIMGEPLLFSTISAHYSFEGGVEGDSVVRFYKSFDGQRFVQFSHSTAPNRSVVVDADLVHHYIRVQVTPIRCDGVKGNISVSKLIYVNVDEKTDGKLLRCLLRGSVEFSVSVLQRPGSAAEEYAKEQARLVISSEHISLTDRAGEVKIMRWITPETHAMLTPAQHPMSRSQFASALWWISADSRLLIDVQDAEHRDIILLVFRAFFCASRPEVVREVFGAKASLLAEDDAEAEIVQYLESRKVDRLLQPETTVRPGSHFTFLAQMEEALLRYEESIAGKSAFSLTHAKLPVVIVNAHTVCF